MQLGAAALWLSGGEGSAAPFDVATDIDPLHWYLATQVTESGGLVDSLNDQGNAPVNFVQVGAARAPIAIDGDGDAYLAFDGAADYYTAGVAADWAFISNGGPFTIAFVVHRPTPPGGGGQTLLDSCGGASANVGMSLYNFTAPSSYYYFVVANGSGFPLQMNSAPITTEKQVVVLRHTGTQAPSPIGVDAVFRRQGCQVGQCIRGPAFVPSNPTYTLNLGRSGAGGSFYPGRVYELSLDDKAWSDRQVMGYEDYARQRYSVPV